MQSLTIESRWNQYDVILVTGDLLDVTISDDAIVNGFRGPFDDVPVPAFLVPGNHDFEQYRQLVDPSSLESLHRERTSVRNWDLLGLGSEIFDEGPEIRTEQELSAEQHHQLRSKIHSEAWHEEPFEEDDVLSEVPISAAGEERYRDQYESLQRLYRDSTHDNRILLTHAPPYNTPLDEREMHDGEGGIRPWGSLAIRNFLAESKIAVHACGHIHESAGYGRVEGTFCVNPGHRQAYALDLDDDQQKITPVELEVT
jgi:Icc-related predicted phosphoesterase